MKSLEKQHRKNRNKFIVVLFLLISMIIFTTWFLFFTFKPDKEEPIGFWEDETISMNEYADKYNQWETKSMAVSYLEEYSTWITSLDLVSQVEDEVNTYQFNYDSFINNEDVFVKHGFNNGVNVWDEEIGLEIDNQVLFVTSEYIDYLGEGNILPEGINIENSIVIFQENVSTGINANNMDINISNSIVINLDIPIKNSNVQEGNSLTIINSFIYGDVFELNDPSSRWNEESLGITNSIVRTESKYEFESVPIDPGVPFGGESLHSFLDFNGYELTVEGII